MKKVLLINGSPNQYGCTYTALKEIKDTLELEGIESEIYWIGKKPISGCIACRQCQEGKCVINDGVNEILAKIDDYGAIIIGSPVYYASISGQLSSFLDRLFYASKGRMQYKLGAAVVSARRAGTSSSLDQINKYFTISEMPIVSSRYWNEVHGNTPSEVKLDLEGMQVMRTLARNTAWLLKCIECGEQNNIHHPIQEKKVITNFIR